MKTTELIKVLTAIGDRYGIDALNSNVYMDALDNVSTNYVVVEVWENNTYDIYITDDDEKFIDNHCFDDDGYYFHGLKSITIWHTMNGVVHGSQVF